MQRSPPGPKSRSPLGEFIAVRRDILGFLTNLAHDYGDVAAFKVGPINAVLLSSPDFIQEVLTTNNRNFVKGRPLRMAKRLLGEGLLTSEGDFHARQSRIVSPSLHPQRLKGYAPTIVDYAQRASRGWSNGMQVNVLDEMIHLATAIAGKTMFQWDIDSSEASGISRAIDDAVSLFPRVVLPYSEWIMRLPLPSNYRFLRARKHLDATIYGLIRKRRAENEDCGDLLSLLLQAQDSEGDGGTMTDEQVRDEALTLFLTAFDTVSLALTWSWYLLAQNAEAELSLTDELDSVLQGKAPTLDDLSRLPFLRMVVSETLRMYPPVYAIARESLRSFTVGGYTFPSETLVLMSPWVMQRDSRYFTDPERFNPARWNPAAGGSRPPRFAYFPFGGGPRGCIGQAYGLQETCLVLATLAQHWRMRLLPGKRVTLQPLLNLRPRNGIEMILESRNK